MSVDSLFEDGNHALADRSRNRKKEANGNLVEKTKTAYDVEVPFVFAVDVVSKSFSLCLAVNITIGSLHREMRLVQLMQQRVEAVLQMGRDEFAHDAGPAKWILMNRKVNVLFCEVRLCCANAKNALLEVLISILNVRVVRLLPRRADMLVDN